MLLPSRVCSYNHMGHDNCSKLCPMLKGLTSSPRHALAIPGPGQAHGGCGAAGEVGSVRSLSSVPPAGQSRKAGVCILVIRKCTVP